LTTPRLPDTIQVIQINVRQQRRDDGLNAKDNFEFERVAAYRKEREGATG